jgi:hypothetical protein
MLAARMHRLGFAAIAACAVTLVAAAAPPPPLRITVYATAGGVERYLKTPQDRERTVAILRKLDITHAVIEGRRGDEYAPPALLKEVRDHLAKLGITTSGGIATVPGRSFGTRQDHPLGWLNWESPATREGIAGFFREDATVFDELVIDDFYCTADQTPASQAARGNRDWGPYRRDLLTGLIPEIVVKPAREANPKVHLIMKFPQWYDRFHMFGYDTARMPQYFDRIWVGVEVRNPKTRRMGYVQPTEGYMNYRWISDQASGKVDAAWFDHIECTAQNFVDQAYASVLAGAPELIFFSLFEVVQGHPGHEAFLKALPQLRDTARRLRGRKADGVFYYKPANSEAGENRFLADYLGMLGLPVVPVAHYPVEAKSVFLGAAAADDPELATKVKASLSRGARVAATRELIARTGPMDGVQVLDNMRTFNEQDYRDSNEWLLPPKELALVDMGVAEVDKLRQSLGVEVSGPTRVGCFQFGRDVAFYSFRDDDVVMRLGRREVRVPAHALVWARR